MKRQIVSCVFVTSVLFSIGCYSPGMVTKEEVKAKAGQIDITLFMKDHIAYEFLKENYRIHGDTLTGFGVRRSNVSSDIVLDASLSFANIDSIGTRVFDPTKTALLCCGVGLGAALTLYIVLHDNEPEQVVVPTAVGHP